MPKAMEQVGGGGSTRTIVHRVLTPKRPPFCHRQLLAGPKCATSSSPFSSSRPGHRRELLQDLGSGFTLTTIQGDRLQGDLKQRSSSSEDLVSYDPACPTFIYSA